MQIKHRKCGILHGQRTGNNWKKNEKTGDTQVSIQNARIPMYERKQAYTYLGYQMNIEISCNNEQVNILISEFKETMTKIDASLLPTSAKLSAVNVMCMSKLNFYYPNIIFTEKDLVEIFNLLDQKHNLIFMVQ